MAFHGSFSVHELLSKEKQEFDPMSTLLGCDVRKMEVTVDKKK